MTHDDDVLIGGGARITNSYLWGNCRIEDGVIIDRAIICDGAIIKKGGIINPGCIISFNTCIGEGFNVQPHVKLTTLPPCKTIPMHRAAGH